MLHFSLEARMIDKLAASAVLHGRSLSEENKARVEQTLRPRGIKAD